MPAERFENKDMRGTEFVNCDLSGAVFKECLLFDSKINGPYGGIRINGINVSRLIWDELQRRYPDRKRLLVDKADGLRDALAYIDELRDRTLARSSALTEDQRQARTPDDEWSIVENLRHLINSEDAWARGRAFGEASESPLGRTNSFMSDDDARARGLRIDERISFDDVVAELEARHALIRERFAALTDDECARASAATDWEGTTARALYEYLSHEWDHHWQIEQIVDALKA